MICRNALDHMPAPPTALRQIWRILKDDGLVFLSVDIGGLPTPDEPTVFSVESLVALRRDRFKIGTQTHEDEPHSEGRRHSVRVLACKQPSATPALDKERLLQAYIERCG